ncbi:outer membrane lipoprotein carrier protein LolA [Belliella kenyensis]|uniref:Outer membrane lipoprotein carrier protein LolA n=1 Tax=Belliella kenyensis TaxID=1472724 RepID=A0ABV8ERB0_9BACT|nr:outer membrane lipoprotein carrier protein LolA [Belliella kenyensis]MCH7402828.1 outer membrane lipoprotein carrier protein LolA [Belliella kenyensis]MDN3602534.1 outer membrane lipoprotein carrier protein LolA [Belliella kenyensis]
MIKRLTLAALLLVSLVGVSHAQKDSNAKAVLDAVSKKYQSLQGMKATFEYSYAMSGEAAQSQSGEIAIKGDKYHLVLPEQGQEIFNNGKTVWTFINSGGYKEVTINNSNEMEDELKPSSVYTIYQKGYNYKLLGERNVNGVLVQEIELKAEKAGAPFKKVNLWVDKNKKDLVGWEITDDQGGKLKYQFKSVDTSIKLSDDYFVFNPQKYGKVEIIDLR